MLRTELNNTLATLITPVVDIPQHLQSYKLMLDYVDDKVSGSTWSVEKANYYTKNQVDVYLTTKAATGHTHTWSEITSKPAFATVATSGSYNDLTDKPDAASVNNFVTLDGTQTIAGEKTFTSSTTTFKNVKADYYGVPDANGFTTGMFTPSDMALAFQVGSSERLRLNLDGSIKLAQYGAGARTGTATYYLAVDSTGKVIETTAPTGGGTGSTPTLQQVTDAGNSTTGGLVVGGLSLNLLDEEKVKLTVHSSGGGFSGKINLMGGGTPYYASIVPTTSNLTASRVLQLPDANGTLATQEWVSAQGYGTGSGSSQWTTSGNDIYYALGGGVAIGSTQTNGKLLRVAGTSEFNGTMNVTSNDLHCLNVVGTHAHARIAVDHANNSGFVMKNGGSAKWTLASYNAGGSHYGFTFWNEQTGSEAMWIEGSNSQIRFKNLQGSGTRMVVADANGALSTQTIPSGGSGSSASADAGAMQIVRPYDGTDMWFFPWNPGKTAATGALSAVFYVPCVIAKSALIKKMGVQMSTAASAGSTLRMALYASNAEGMPGTKLFESATIASSTDAVPLTTTVDVNVTPGLYWLAVQNSNTSGTYVGVEGSLIPIPSPIINYTSAAYLAGYTYAAALPNNPTIAMDDVHFQAPRIGLVLDLPA